MTTDVHAPDSPEALVAPPPASGFGLTTRTLRPEIRRIGVTQQGEWYLYGATPDDPNRQPVEAIATPRIIDVSVVSRGKGSSFGKRDYLDVAMVGETPSVKYILSLPCSMHSSEGKRLPTQRSVRSLLGALLAVDGLAARPLKLEPSRGKRATFTNVYFDFEGQQPVTGEDIGPDEIDLRRAVNATRSLLGLPPQFREMADASVDPAPSLNSSDS
jgi:hypothetical protein